VCRDSGRHRCCRFGPPCSRPATDAPDYITGAMAPLADAYVTANANFASIGYRALPMSEQDAIEEQAALQAVTAVASQAQQVDAYVLRVCGFQFALNGV